MNSCPSPPSTFLLLSLLGSGGLMVRSRLQGRRVPGSKPYSIEDPPCMGLLHTKSYVLAKCPPAGAVPTSTDPPMGSRVHWDGRGTGVVMELGERVPAHVSPSLPDRGS
ncbi:hypothetical protein AVEN_113910-1 [Araneus ventricosus]|uniref:Uncharacterized protein n=1 Tax=Araneus ventricosus TaxID=182803 RepID=A0A4Y2LGC8_ARAVE|nr:hypothetical protein AVEN_113910-1 [Araneus ventricosus]